MKRNSENKKQEVMRRIFLVSRQLDRCVVLSLFVASRRNDIESRGGIFELVLNLELRCDTMRYGISSRASRAV